MSSPTAGVIGIGAPRSTLARLLAVGLPAVGLLLVVALPAGAGFGLPFLGFELMPLRVDALSRLFAIVFAGVATAAGLFSFRHSSGFELTAALAYAVSAVGAVFAGDLISFLVCWELMALSSTLVVWAAGTDASYKSGLRYLLVHLFGGMLLMAGIAAHAAGTGSIAFSTLGLHAPGGALILAGILVNAAAWPLSAWLADAYPEASPAGTVYLSAFTTKTAVYALLRGFPGEGVLVVFGLVMIFYGIVYALLENDMRRMFAYSIVSQVGFMVTAVGIGTPLALNAAAAHAFAHIFYKALLLTSAGSVLAMTGRRTFTDLGGLYRTMPVTAVSGIIGGLAISAFPLTSGFVTKSLIAEAATEEHFQTVWLLLQAASAGTFLYAGLKFPCLAFFGRHRATPGADPPWNMQAAMVLLAAVSVGLGIAPGLLYGLLPYPVEYIPYTGAHLVMQLQVLLFSAIAFMVMFPYLQPRLTITLDVDWIYRRLGLAFAHAVGAHRAAMVGRLERNLLHRLDRLILHVSKHHGPEGILARTWPIGSTVLWVAVLLMAYLLIAAL